MHETKFEGISSFTLHILAMSLMLCDHLWATLFPAQEWMTCIGRLAFPIFAFMTVEGYFHTSNFKRYVLRLFVFAIISEIPFNYIYGSSMIYPFHQNVLWTFLIALLSIRLIDKIRAKYKLWISIPLIAMIIILDYYIGTLSMVDYFGAGVLMVLVFYFFHGKSLLAFAGQLICMYILNVNDLGSYFYEITLFGHNFKLMQQGFAMFALIPIWLYNGRQGYHSKAFQYLCYAFYPGHLILLYLLWQFML